MTKFILLSDLHGNLPNVPEGDVLLIAGDICPNFAGYKDKFEDTAQQFIWMGENFYPWVESLPVKQTIFTWGNHDFIGDSVLYSEKIWTHKVKDKTIQVVKDAEVKINGIKIYLTPWSVTFGGNWTFNKPDKELQELWDKVPLDIDILVTHGPPYMAGDECPALANWTPINFKENVGSKTLRSAIEKIQPKLVVCGHIHEGRGFYKIGETLVVNASILDGDYNHVHEPIIWEM